MSELVKTTRTESIGSRLLKLKKTREYYLTTLLEESQDVEEIALELGMKVKVEKKYKHWKIIRIR